MRVISNLRAADQIPLNSVVVANMKGDVQGGYWLRDCRTGQTEQRGCHDQAAEPE
jgi:hypothetical protein